jgi:YHYH protein
MLQPARRTRLSVILIATCLTAASCGDDGADTATADPATTTAAVADPGVTGTTAAPADTAPGTASTPYDPTRLAVGDDMFSTAPTVGRIYSCQTTFNGGGASAQGPWFNGDGTWDSTKKISVQGSVQWDAASVRFSLSGGSRVITANALPGHATGTFPIAASDPAGAYDRNPNSISAQEITATLPATPTAAEAPSCVRGEVGIAVNGVPIFDGFDAGGRDAVAWEVQDSCHGHPQMSGVYHYHDVSPCLDESTEGHSSLVGYAWDGFGIYGPRGEAGVSLRNEDLDECHGHTHTIEWDGASVEMYHYHATAQFPYTVGCFRGTSAQGQPIGG